jgi:uncharacterized protein YjbI with pentapeptide repeats
MEEIIRRGEWARRKIKDKERDKEKRERGGAGCAETRRERSELGLRYSQMKQDIWNELANGKQIDFSGAPQHGGRLDLRGVVVSGPRSERTIQHPAGEYTIVSGLTDLKGGTWKSIDFTGSHLNSLRFNDCALEDCRFDDCTCRDWRMWETSFTNCSFRQADMRDSAFGAVSGERRNVFKDVDFTEADMRGTMYTSAEFSRCVFRNTRLVKVDFQGSVFTDCVFEGELDEVLFYDKGFNAKHLQANELLRTDFSRARFRHVEFRRLNLETVRFPEGDEHIRVDNFPQVIAAILSNLKGKEDLPSRKLAAVIGHKQKWLGTMQRRGVLSKRDILSAGGREGLDMILGLIEPHK